MRGFVRPAVLVLTLAASACASSWAEVRGDGVATTEKRQVAPFQRIVLDSSLDLDVREGPDCSVTITIDQNLQPLIVASVSGDTLTIRSTGSYSTRGGRATVTLPRLAGVTLDGSGDAVIEGRDEEPGDLELVVNGSGDVRYRGQANQLRTVVRGSGDVTLAGQARQLVVNLDGSGDVDARALAASAGDYSVSGSGNIQTDLRGGEARFRISGSGDIRWTGDARVVQTAISGTGTIERG